MTRLVSGRIQKIPSANVSAERYQFIEISEVEPDLGLPSALGQVFTSDLNGTRYWINLDTANINETSNLYFTNTRAILALDGAVISVGNLISQDRIEGNTLSVSNIFADLITANTIISNTWVNLYSSNVIEFQNLFYTNARVLSHLSQSDVETRNLTIYGNLNVVGNLTTINASTLEITDPLIKIAANNETSDAVDFGWLGHYSPDSGATRQHAGVFRKHNTDNFYIFSEYVDEELDIGNLVTNINLEDPTFKLANVYGNVFHGRISSLENHTTDALVEGTNLYYTNTRVVSAVTPLLTTANVVETDNLYYTNARVDAYINDFIDTDDIDEANNLYYTNTRVVSAVTPLLTTANVLELSSNLYYTNTRVLAFVETLSISDLRDVSNIYAANVQGLQGIQTGQALVWDGNINQFVPVFVNSEIGNVADLSVRVLSLENFTTANITEASSNLYFTNTRVLSAVTPLLTTANVTELDNLYYTDARVLANVSQMSANVLADIDMTDISIGQILVWDGNKFIPGTSDIALFSETANSALFANTVGSL